MKNVFWKHFNDVISRCTKEPMWPHWRNRATTAWHLLLSLTPLFSPFNLFTFYSPRFFIFFLLVGGTWTSCQWSTLLFAAETTAIAIHIFTKAPFIYYIRNAKREVENRFLTWNVWQIESACHPPPPFPYGFAIKLFLHTHIYTTYKKCVISCENHGARSCSGMY